MKKLIILSIISLIFISLFYILISKKLNKKPENQLNIKKYFLENTLLTIQSNYIPTNFEELSKNEVTKSLMANDTIKQAIENNFKLFEAFFKDFIQEKNFSKTFFSLVIDNNKLHFQILTTNETKIGEKIKKIENNNDKYLIEKNFYQNEKIWIIKLKDDNKYLYFWEDKQLKVITNDLSILKQTIDNRKIDTKLPQNNDEADISVNFEKINQYLQSYILYQPILITQLLKPLKKGFFNIFTDKNIIKINGTTTIDTNSWLTKISYSQKTYFKPTLDIISDQTSFFISLKVRDLGDLFRTINTYETQTSNSKYQNLLLLKNTLEKNKKISINNNFYKWLGDEITYAEYSIENKSSLPNDFILVLNIKNADSIDKFFKLILDKNEITQIETYKNHEINLINKKNFLNVIFSSFLNLDKIYFLNLKDFMLFTPNYDLIIKTIDDFEQNRTLKQYLTNKNFDIRSNSNLTIYINTNKINKRLSQITQNGVKQILLLNKKTIGNFSDIFINSEFNNTNIDIQAIIRYDTNAYFNYIAELYEYSTIDYNKIYEITSKKFIEEPSKPLKSGKLIEYQYTKIPKFEINYENYQKQGIYKIYYKSGNLKINIYFQKNKAEGPAYYFYDNEINSLQFEFNYVNDQLEGKMIEYYPTHELKSIINFKNNKLEDTAKFFYHNGNPKMIAIFRKNSKIGIWSFFKENGELIFHKNYENGKIEK